MKIYNTLTRQKEEFVPIEPGKVKMYACGPTVYNFIHIGNARPICVFDTLRRYLDYDVTFVQNFTDIDDKLINKANEEGITVKEVAERYIGEYLTDTEGLGIRPANIHPRATENIDTIIEMVRILEEKGYAYAHEGSVYFRSRRFSGSCPTSRWKNWNRARGSMSAKPRRTRSILSFGKPQSWASRAGPPRGGRVVRAGISSAAP